MVLGVDTVDELRESMIRLAEEKGSLTHPDVVKMSQRLDVLIAEIQAKRFDDYRAEMAKNKRRVRPLWPTYNPLRQVIYQHI